MKLFSTDIRKVLKFHISWKSGHWEPRCSTRTDRQTDGEVDRHDEANSHFSKYCESD